MESTLRRGAGDPDLKLIETLGWDGAIFKRLDLHMARLAASAQRLGWRCDPVAVRAALGQVAPLGAARIRLTLDARGGVAVTTAAMPAVAALWRVGLAAAVLASDDPWLGIKSTNRAVYDTARAQMPPGLDEVIFQNERGEVCDGSISTLFFDKGDGLCTPPLTCGLLPGVMRAALLNSGAVREAVLLAVDLPQAKLQMGNSLRGLIPAFLVVG